MPDSSGTNWTGIIALGVSAAAFARTILAGRRDAAKDVRTTKSARFETDFGEPIRDELRSFEKTLGPLRVLRLTVATPPKDRLSDLPDRRQEWDKAAAEVEMLLREAEISPAVICDYWADSWQNNIAGAEGALQTLQDLGEPSDADVRENATTALESYIKAIRDARTGLETERSLLQPLPPAGIFEWIRETFLGFKT